MGYYDTAGFYHDVQATLPISLHALREATTGDVGAIAANGGILASDTTPTMTGASSGVGQIVTWAASNSDQVLTHLSLPADFDGRDDVQCELWVSSGTTDPATFSVLTSWDGGADVTDTVTDGAKSATVHKITGTISRSDIPDNAAFVSVALVPGAHTTNAIVLYGARLLYTKKVRN